MQIQLLPLGKVFSPQRAVRPSEHVARVFQKQLSLATDAEARIEDGHAGDKVLVDLGPIDALQAPENVNLHVPRLLDFLSSRADLPLESLVAGAHVLSAPAVEVAIRVVAVLVRWRHRRSRWSGI